MQADAYLERIRYRGPREPSPAALVELHRTHMFTVPFENLDIPLGSPISLSLPAIYEKIVVRGRGGFCYELNGLFAWLLGRMGFTVELLSARVFGDGQPGPDFDHLVLLVKLRDPMIADVGFGDSFVEPLRLSSGEVTEQQGMSYRLTESASTWLLEHAGSDGRWQPRFQFTLTPRDLADFDAMCEDQQTSPQSSFTRKAVCSLATPSGRITLANGRLITTFGARRIEQRVETAGEYRSLLDAKFGVHFEEDAQVDRLLAFGTAPRTE